MKPLGPPRGLPALAQRRQQLLQRSQAQRVALAGACAAVAGRLRAVDTAWRLAVTLSRHPAVLALSAVAWAWWAARRARRIAPPQSAREGTGRR